ncbi:glycerol-3-phosphate 1-O-acyltransferase PlsY [Xylocopilactobacillus apicola]|uniref:Glycerol-3-phosphate acyltransferase n=1 Tax=Xylocopilactobacillus apicola TaxID=2932184 RepID=A0AAU9DES3_9LACO|nr:glycerol-3-phosphate 1-O-acyltransferase PlsY [Xylocopilactobacillus apicola]BDR58410.1 glycerol-3-phosphate acyltransferase [Xylocopilactobacillus apicola]
MSKLLIFTILCLIAYLIGSIPFGVLIGKWFKHTDIRNYGSHSIGTTNAYRVLGTKLGSLVLMLDMLKGTLSASLPIIFGHYPHYYVIICGFFAVLGHTFSIFLKFRGGKAVATGAGILLAYEPILFILTWIVFLTTVFFTSAVSMGSILGFIFVNLVSFFVLKDPILSPIAFILLIIVIYRHRENIKRIKKGQENLVPFGLIYWRKNKK